ncbi:hypothetical protein HDU67_003669, partial [Dinochytrium kinnereticum]
RHPSSPNASFSKRHWIPFITVDPYIKYTRVEPGPIVFLFVDGLLFLWTAWMLNPVRRAEAQYLRDAIASGDLYLCKKIMLKKKLPIQSPNPENGWPLLFYAIRYNQNEIVEYLLDKGHEFEQCSKDFDGNTALMIAAEYKNDQAFQMYVKRHPEIISWENKNGRSAIIIATEKAMNAAVI